MAVGRDNITSEHQQDTVAEQAVLQTCMLLRTPDCPQAHHEYFIKSRDTIGKEVNLSSAHFFHFVFLPTQTLIISLRQIAFPTSAKLQ